MHGFSLDTVVIILYDLSKPPLVKCKCKPANANAQPGENRKKEDYNE
jgi:hypothetical protein